MVGLSLEEAEKVLQGLNLNYRLHDDAPDEPKSSALIKAQSTEPGEIIRADEQLILTIVS